MRQLLQNAFGKLTRLKPLDSFSLAAAKATHLPLDIPIEEERKQDYDSRHYYPVRLGEILHDKYQVVVKVGFGAGSTVWLARNLQRFNFKERYAILKVSTSHADCAPEEAHQELRLSRQIASAKPAHPGLEYIRLVQGSFTISGPARPHLCLVYVPMREPLWLLQRRTTDGRYSFGLLAYTTKFLLTGLSYLHNECSIIHTGGSFTNVLVGLEKTLSLDDIVADEINSPSPRKMLPDRTIYLSRNDFGHPKSTPGRPKITDFDTAVQMTGSQKTFSHPIQPNCYRAPEVILGAPWSYPVDIWNLGAMLWDLLEGKALFDGSDSNRNGEYSSHAHLAQVIDLLGPPPKELLARGAKAGLHFNSGGEFMARCNVRPRKLVDTVSTIGGAEKEDFLRFASRMLEWLPERRATALELLDDPWMRSLPG
ncbi:hypothetical protein M413DRAFT_408715 [Hebeloma cylindrosporum]|uniref:non-specific serine/threonine protein kinase n=1 Tax=Hebeloma cylindrosporum TaxID=76867 RepID=A0A0C3CGI8_HEBCY|nr:hypothetical protein M413DRAFT_408715 [Hebeloma cylindrosporum h7]